MRDPAGIRRQTYYRALTRLLLTINGVSHWQDEARRLSRAMLSRSGVSYKRLALRLERIGVKTTAAAIANRVHRGSLSLAFILQCAAVLGIDELDLTAFRPIPGPDPADESSREPTP